MKAFIFYGGWSGHTPKESAELVAAKLHEQGVEVVIDDKLDRLSDLLFLESFDVIIPVWTMGTLSKEQTKALSTAVKNGVGLAGFHGGTGDAFRGNLEYEWMVGGIFAAHPYVGKYTVRVTDSNHPATKNLPACFDYESEKYYMLIDPANNVLATTEYDFEGRKSLMPVIWTKTWGKGKIFYSALGHTAQELTAHPPVLEMTINGIIWAAE